METRDNKKSKKSGLSLFFTIAFGLAILAIFGWAFVKVVHYLCCLGNNPLEWFKAFGL